MGSAEPSWMVTGRPLLAREGAWFELLMRLTRHRCDHREGVDSEAITIMQQARASCETDSAMNKTKIRWTNLTLNLWSGCTRISPACRWCYAETFAERLRGTRGFPNGFELTYRPHKLDEPLRIKEPALVFVNSMSDFFDENVPDDWRDRLLEIMRATPHLQYQVLTKRPKVMLDYCERREIPDNVWLGVSVELPIYLSRVDLLRKARASGPKFISAEPLLADLGTALDLSGISQVIAGGESGPHLHHLALRTRRGMAIPLAGNARTIKGWQPRADRIDWARHLRDACLTAGVAFFWKQWGGPTPDSAGHVLDGRTWDEQPRVLGEDGRWHDWPTT
jgi:protein gp37